MARQLDATAFAALTKLLDKVTDKHEAHQDSAVIQQIKAFCKQSDENITWISSVLLHRLKEEHAQVSHPREILLCTLMKTMSASQHPALTLLPLLAPNHISAAPAALELSASSQ